MPNAENALMYMEMGQTFQDFVALVDSGDHKKFNASAHQFSRRSGYAPTILPDGVVNGLEVTVGVSGSNNKIDVSAGYVYLTGVLTSISAAADETVVRSSDPETHSINSVQVTSAGAIAIITGLEGSSFSETRGAAGGPPAIVVGSIEIAQVRLTSFTAAVVLSSEIFAVPNLHRERYDYPTWQVKHSRVSGNVLQKAGVDFDATLPLSHTAGVPKKVYARYYKPIFAELPKTASFVPAEQSHSVSSTQIYGSAIGATSASLGQGAFTAYLENNISDPMIAYKNEILWFKYLQDRTVTSRYILTQGKLGITRANPAGDNLSAACTISADEASQEVTAEVAL